MNFRIAAILTTALLAAFFLLAPGSALASEKSSLAEAEKERAALMKDKKAQGLRHEWLNVIKRYDRFLNQYPKSGSAPDAALTSADLYLGLYKRSRRQADLEDGMKRYRYIAKAWPGTSAAARSQLAIGRYYLENQNDPEQAYVELLKVELNHPKDKEAVAEARQLMTRISGRDPYKEAVAEVKPPRPESGLAQVMDMRHWHNPTYTRVAIDLDREVKFKDHLLRSDPKLKKPMRLYLDLQGAKVAPGAKDEVVIGDGLLESARLGQYDSETVRVVLDIRNIYNYRIFSLTNPFRIVVDVTGNQEPEATVTADAGKTEEEKKELADLRETALKRPKNPRGKVKEKPDQASLARQLGLGVHKIVIDPGHGGKDHGATGITGLREKDLALKVARLLAAKIRKRLGLEVILTRNKDVFLTLEERMGKANTEAADLFISIHANAHKSSKVHGVETYILNIATDEEAMRVAARENAATQKSMSDLQVILSDLMLNAKIAESGNLGLKVHKSVVGRLKRNYKNVRDLGVKQAPFYVLIGANMPSILVEMGFISNKTEESRLKNQKYIDHLTDGLVEGVKAYVDSFKKTS